MSEYNFTVPSIQLDDMSSSTSSLSTGIQLPSTRNISTLPGEVRILILKQCAAISDDRLLLREKLVCREWYTIAASIAYRRINLLKHEISPFLEAFQSASHVPIHFLTTTIGGISSSMSKVEDDDRLDDALLKLTGFLPRLRCMNTFSLKAEPQPTLSRRNTIRRDMLAEVIDYLPPSCVNLEIDTGFADENSEDTKPHICHSLRKILPRMCHVRVRIQAMCSEMFGVGKIYGNSTRRSFEPLSLPNLRSLVVNCRGSFIYVPCHHCSVTRANNPSTFELCSAFLSVSRAMKALASSRRMTTPSAMICLSFCSLEPGFLDDSHHFSLNHTDFMIGRTIAYPVLSTRTTPRPYLGVRDLAGHDVRGSEEDLDIFAEGEFWRTLQDGCRVPTPLVNDVDVLPGVEPVIRSLSLVRSDAPAFGDLPVPRWHDPLGPSSTLQDREMLTGECLIAAEIRADSSEFLSEHPLREHTPLGWRRSGLYRNILI